MRLSLATAYGTPLSAAELAAIARDHGTTLDIVSSADLFRVTSEQGKLIVGRNGSEDYAGIVFPHMIPGVPGSCAHRLRRDNPPYEIRDGVRRAKDKYLSAPGWSNRLYFHPNTDPASLRDPKVDVWLTEGQWKTLTL